MFKCYVLYVCILYKAFVFLNKSKMLVAGQKRKNVRKKLREKTQAFKDIRLSNKEDAAKSSSIPKNSIATRVKKKIKFCHYSKKDKK